MFLWNREEGCILKVKSNKKLEIMKAIISILTVLFLSAFSMAPDQARLINGTVSDEAGNPMAGVTIVVKGTSNGTVTDLNGAFQLQVNAEAKYLVFSYIGYETEEVKISRSNSINVTLQPAVVALEEVVSYEYDMASPTQGRVSGVPVRESSKSYHKRAHYQTYAAPEPGYVPHNTE